VQLLELINYNSVKEFFLLLCGCSALLWCASLKHITCGTAEMLSVWHLCSCQPMCLCVNPLYKNAAVIYLHPNCLQCWINLSRLCGMVLNECINVYIFVCLHVCAFWRDRQISCDKTCDKVGFPALLLLLLIMKTAFSIKKRM